MRRYFLLIVLGWSACMVLIGVGLTNVYDSFSSSSSSSSSSSELRAGLSGFTNPLLECEIGVGTIGSRKEDFTPQLESFVDSIKRKYDIRDVSVYFRDLNNGPIVGVNQNIPFSPASLLKVPIMMTYLSRSEADPSLLSQTVKFDTDAGLMPDQRVMPTQKLELGNSYTVDELIQHMIKYSDNQAMALLYKGLPVAEQVNLYQILGVDPSVINDDTATLSVRQYSTFFRILFNSSFLSRTNSDRALKLLSESTFTEGLRAGVPASVNVAHKFGERKFDTGLQQFHDCGIVYYPQHPYLLCIMMRGQTTESLIHAIADTATFVYEKIDAQYSSKN